MPTVKSCNTVDDVTDVQWVFVFFVFQTVQPEQC